MNWLPDTWTAVASLPTIDLNDEVIEQGAFEPLPEIVPVRDTHFGGHLVGGGWPRYQGNQLLIDGRFVSTARALEVLALVRMGHLWAMSLVFLTISDGQVAGRHHITRGELLAVDWTADPINPDCRVLRVSSEVPRGSEPTEVSTCGERRN